MSGAVAFMEREIERYNKYFRMVNLRTGEPMILALHQPGLTPSSVIHLISLRHIH
jgi:hypothetical protein